MKTLSNFSLRRLVVESSIFLSVLSCSSDIPPSRDLVRTEVDQQLFEISAIDAERFVIENRIISEEDSSFFSNIKLLWNKAYHSENAAGKYLLVPTEHGPMQQTYYNENSELVTRQYPNMNLVAYREGNGAIRVKYLLVSPSNSLYLGHQNWISNFTGHLIYFTLSGKVENILTYTDGREHLRLDSQAQPSGNKANRCALMWECYYTGADPNLGHEIWGHYSISSNPCMTMLYINGRPTRLPAQLKHMDVPMRM